MDRNVDTSDGVGDDVNGSDNVSEVSDAIDVCDNDHGNDGNNACCNVGRVVVYVGLNCAQSNNVRTCEPQHLQCIGVVHVRAVCSCCAQFAQNICDDVLCDMVRWCEHACRL